MMPARPLPPMRPLAPLFAEVSSLKGLGKKTSEHIAAALGKRVIDLLFHFPTRVIYRRRARHLFEYPPQTEIVLRLNILAHKKPPRGRRHIPYKIACVDDEGQPVTLVFFHAYEAYLMERLPPNSVRFVCGRVELYGKTVQISHPARISTPEDEDNIPLQESLYPLPDTVSQKTFQNAVERALMQSPALPEWLDPALLAQKDWPDWRESMTRCHTDPFATATARALERLAYDEILSSQLALGLIRMHTPEHRGQSIQGDGILRHALRQALPFQLTAGQASAVDDIERDMARPVRMRRLIQGDVGSGKTVVALLAMLNAVEAGYQCALMAPTEILARQHVESLRALCADLPVSIACLTGKDTAAARRKTLAAVADGSIQILIGTHALFQDTVQFRALGLAVIDEQHRFGVHQRLALSDKGERCDILVMTATPIPRTLLMTVYGDLEVSRITEKPAGRKPVDTRLVNLDRLDELVHSLRRPLDTGAKIYWVCPLVEESELIDLAAAEERYHTLQQIFGDRVGLLHGRMKPDEKQAVMQRFITGEHDILVSTTVIEVGVNVPTATVMIIEHAERFGLSQLHQLRGRVGRGAATSSCVLLYKSPLSATAQTRLNVMRASEDGFYIAEEDFRLRGGGEILGTRQSGTPDFRIADLFAHQDLLTLAHNEVKFLLDKDPHLTSTRGQALRLLLRLFERGDAVRYLKSG